MPPYFKRAVIHGVGLLGGSLGMAMRRRDMAECIVGLGRSRKRLEMAMSLGAIDECQTDAAAALADADALITCLPPRQIRRKWNDFAELIEPGAFVTDVGSVKAELVDEAEERLAPGVLFIGSHPMAGSEKSGVDAARGDLFEGAGCFLTPTERTHEAAIPLASEFWRALGARVIIANPARHDRLMASISHMPHLAAAVLVQNLFAGGDSTQLFQAISGNGFRDTTRIAAGPSDVWEQIFSENSEAMIENIDRVIGELESWKGLLKEKDSASKLSAWLKQAAEYREALGPESESAD